MKSSRNLLSIAALLLGVWAASVTLVSAQRGPQREPLGFLKRALTEANAPALTAEQETQLTEFAKAFHDTRPQGPNETLKAARTAYDNAVLSGDLAAAQAQAALLANQLAEMSSQRLQAETKFKIDVLTVLKNGGQLDALQQKFGTERVLGIISSLAGPPLGGPGGRPGFGPGGPGSERPGFAPGGPGNGFNRRKPSDNN